MTGGLQKRSIFLFVNDFSRSPGAVGNEKFVGMSLQGFYGWQANTINLQGPMNAGIILQWKFRLSLLKAYLSLLVYS